MREGETNGATMKPAELCIDCVQSFFDWWKEGEISDDKTPDKM